jgi:hypothetical protein
MADWLQYFDSQSDKDFAAGMAPRIPDKRLTRETMK